MRILAITFALALVGCVDDGFEVPEGFDDIEEQNDDLGPDTHKSDIDQQSPSDGTDLPQIQEGPPHELQQPQLPQIRRTVQADQRGAVDLIKR